MTDDDNDPCTYNRQNCSAKRLEIIPQPQVTWSHYAVTKHFIQDHQFSYQSKVHVQLPISE